MRFKARFLLTVSVLTIFIASAQESIFLSSLTIPKSLTTNANAVLRLEENNIVLNSYKSMNVKYKRVVTVLNKKGNTNVDAFLHFDKNVGVKKLSAIVYNKFGKQLKKIKKKDFMDVSAVSGGTLYSDSRVYYLDYTPISYPYTVVFEYEYETSNTAFLTDWRPLKGYYISTEKSVYSLSWKEDIEIRSKEKNFEGFAIKNNSSSTQLSYSVENVAAVRKEALSPDFKFIAPRVLVAANKFHLEGVDGYASNWKEFGIWYAKSLLHDTSDLSEETKSEVRKMVSGVDDPIEKAKIIHKYMQEKTRYISVQIGIGGWKPMLASEVDRLGYGDCKALTNYTKALLEAVDVTSYVTIIYGDSRRKRSIDDGFMAMQGNHAILAIKDKEDLVWVDCTSQVDPFGFVAGFTDDRMALVVKPGGGEMIRTIRYTEEENHLLTKAVCKLDTIGNLSGEVEIKARGTQYSDRYGSAFNLETSSKKEIEKYYKENYWDYINNLSLEKSTFSNDKEKVVFSENVSVQAEAYATISGDRILVAPNVFNKVTYVPKRYRNRKQNVVIERGYLDEDEIIVKLPKGYKIEAKPDDVDLKTKFGTYSFSISTINDELVYKRKLLMIEGVHPKEEYVNYRSFRKQIKKLDNSKIILKKTKID